MKNQVRFPEPKYKPKKPLSDFEQMRFNNLDISTFNLLIGSLDLRRVLMGRLKTFSALKASPQNKAMKMTKEENHAVSKIIVPWLLIAALLGWAASTFEYLQTFDAAWREQVANIFGSIRDLSYQNEYATAVRVVSYYFIVTTLIVAWLLIPCMKRSVIANNKDKYLVAAFFVLLFIAIRAIFGEMELSITSSKGIKSAYISLLHAGWFGVVLGLYIIYGTCAASLSFIVNLFRR